VLTGSRAAMHRGRRIRKLLGGGMRQSGMLAAAAQYALTHNVDRLALDHSRAKRLAAGLASLGFGLTEPDTNILYVEVSQAEALVLRLEEQGIRCLAVSPDRIRLVTHLDVNEAGIDQTLQAFSSLREFTA